MPGTSEITQVGKKEDFAEIIAVADARKTPVTTAMPKGKKPTNTKFSWQADKYDDTNTDGVLSGKDVDSYEDAARNRKRLENFVQRFWKTPKVDTMSEEVSEVAGINNPDPQGVAGATEFARAKSKKTIELKRNIEAAILSDNEAQEEDGTIPYKLRGLGRSIQNAAQTVLPFPTEFRTPTASVFTGALTGFAEDNLRALLQSRHDTVGLPSGNLMGVVGSGVKNRISDFTRFTPLAASTASLRTFDHGKTTTVSTKVDIYEGDYGTLELMISQFLPNINRGYILDMEYLELRTHTMPRIKPLPDLGGGPRALIEAIVGLAVLHPQAHCQIVGS